MNEIICYTPLLPNGEAKQLSFADILLDDRWTTGKLLCPENIYWEIGDFNQKLHAGQNYEFLLRAAAKYPIKAVGLEGFQLPETEPWEAFRTDCYVAGKYQEWLKENSCFDVFVTALIQQAFQMPWKEKGIAFLESMISRSPDYYDIDDNTRPILLYYGADICQNLLNYFIDSLADAFRQCHQRVEIFDGNKEGFNGLTKYIGKRFKAIIGMQTAIFTFKMQDSDVYLHDLIHGPKYNMVFDHPFLLMEAIQQAPKDYYLLLHDRNYIQFSRRYFNTVTGIIHLPPAGFLPETTSIPMEFSMEKRAYDLSFIASYRNYRERLAVLYQYDRIHRHLAARYLSFVRKHPDATGEEALQHAVNHFGLQLSDTQFLELFYDMRQVYFCTFLYFREKIITTLLDAGIPLHVFGNSWTNAPFANHPCLTRHPDVDAMSSLEIMQNSKVSLNIMSWHKDGMTERVFNGMLCQSVILTDSSTALQEEFIDGQDIVLFSLDKLNELPHRVKALLADNAQMEKIALNGYEKALSKHTWKQRAEQLLKEL